MMLGVNVRYGRATSYGPSGRANRPFEWAFYRIDEGRLLAVMQSST